SFSVPLKKLTNLSLQYFLALVAFCSSKPAPYGFAAPYGFGLKGLPLAHGVHTFKQEVHPVPVAQPIPVPVVKTVAQPVPVVQHVVKDIPEPVPVPVV